MTICESTQQIARSLDDQSYSAAFVEAEIATTIPFQIRAMRREREWTQTDLANATEQHQKTISDFENPDIGPGSIKSLLKIAAAFDVGLIVRFAPFSELVDWSVSMTSASHFVPSRTKDTKLRSQRKGTDATGQASTHLQLPFDEQTIQNPGKVFQMSKWKAATKPKITTSDDTLSRKAVREVQAS
jgi:transcriptional regulator with XRE-family HTH domain